MRTRCSAIGRVTPDEVWRAAGIRDHMVQAVELKFNCFLLMPVVDAFPSRLRAELEVRSPTLTPTIGDALGMSTVSRRVILRCAA